MALQITENNGVFYLKGNLNNSTLMSFINYFHSNLSLLNKVVLNIDNVKEIDKNGLEAMRKFTQIADIKQKSFSIIGYGCKEIYDHFNQTKVA